LHTVARVFGGLDFAWRKDAILSCGVLTAIISTHVDALTSGGARLSGRDHADHDARAGAWLPTAHYYLLVAVDHPNTTAFAFGTGRHDFGGQEGWSLGHGFCVACPEQPTTSETRKRATNEPDVHCCKIVARANKRTRSFQTSG
jgi:hypothetical protein